MYSKFLEKFNEKLVVSCNGLTECTIKDYFFCVNVTVFWKTKNKLINFFYSCKLSLYVYEIVSETEKKQKGFYFYNEI